MKSLWSILRRRLGRGESPNELTARGQAAATRSKSQQQEADAEAARAAAEETVHQIGSQVADAVREAIAGRSGPSQAAKTPEAHATKAPAAKAAVESALDRVCREALDRLKERQEPPKPVAPGRAGPMVRLSATRFGEVVRAAIIDRYDDVVLWRRGDDELLVVAEKIELKSVDGALIALIPVSCDQTGPAQIEIAFAVGSSKRPAGLLAATETRPRGPAIVVEAWGDALIALAWGALLGGLERLARQAGQDVDGFGLAPAALTATTDGVELRTMARHRFERGPAAGVRALP